MKWEGYVIGFLSEEYTGIISMQIIKISLFQLKTYNLIKNGPSLML